MDDSKMPFRASFQSLEVYDYDVSTGTFNFSWSDNFQGGLDESKWTVADGVGWDQNLSTFEKTQLEVEDQSLTLIMNKNSQNYEDANNSRSPAFLAMSSFLN